MPSACALIRARDEPATRVHAFDWELNSRLFGKKANALIAEQHQPGQVFYILANVLSGVLTSSIVNSEFVISPFNYFLFNLNIGYPLQK